MSGKEKIMTKSELKGDLSMVIDDLLNDDKATVWNILFPNDQIYSMYDFNSMFDNYTPLDIMDMPKEEYFCSANDYFWYNSDGEITSGDFEFTSFDKDVLINEIIKNIHLPYLNNFSYYDGLEKLNEAEYLRIQRTK